jgi:uncharacterized delta-60 repeat protein
VQVNSISWLSYRDEDRDFAVQTDGKIVVSSSIVRGTSGYDFALSRFNIDGSYDLTFSSNGYVTTDFGGQYDKAWGVEIQNDGKIVVIGTNGIGPYLSYFAVVRYLPNGNVDKTFSEDGKLTTAFGSGGYADAYDVAIQPDGRIVVAGSYAGDFALARYLPNGELDPSFSGDGLVRSLLLDNHFEWASCVYLLPSGKILVAGSVEPYYNGDSSFALLRYNSDGTVDTTFAENGLRTTHFGSTGSSDYGEAIAVQPDGKILVAGSSWNGANSDFALARYFPNGRLDKSFSGDGKVTIDVGWDDSAYDISVGIDGKILVTGSAAGQSGQVRFNSDGTLDVSFDLQTLVDATPIYTENAQPIDFDADVEIYDQELGNNSYDGASLTLSRKGGPRPEDIFSSKADGGTLSELVEGSAFTVDGITVGFVSKNSDGELILIFGVNATRSLVNSAMQQIAYSNTSDALPDSVEIQWIFSDGNTGAQGIGESLNATRSIFVEIININDTPILISSLDDAAAQIRQSFSYSIPVSSFQDPDSESLTYSISNIDGSELPPWLSFDATARVLSGTPEASDAGVLDIKVTVSDSSGEQVSDVFSLTVASAIVINGTPGNDRLRGYSADDVINGFYGNDTLIGGLGVDTLAGGEGNDTYVVTAGDLIIDNPKNGIDTVQSSTTWTLGANTERLLLTGMSNSSGTGNALANKITGNGGNNVLRGLDGKDSLFGGAGDDVISGGSGGDVLFGGAGTDVLDGGLTNDFLSGGEGNDLLIGSAGADVFLFDSTLSATLNQDTVADFSAGLDMVRLDLDIFPGLSIGDALITGQFFAAAGASEALTFEHRIIYDVDTGKLYYDEDGAGGAYEAIHFATFSTRPLLSESDFVIVA